MSDRVWHVEPPLTEAERAHRFDPFTRIRVEHGYGRLTIRRDWVRNDASADASYGYADVRGTERIESAALDLKVDGTLDAADLTAAILREIERQRKAAS